MTFGVVIVLLAVAGGVVLFVRQAKTDVGEKQQGIQRFGGCVLAGDTIRVGVAAHAVTTSTHAEVLGGVHEGRRSTATRTVAGAAVVGPVGAIVGHAAKKKTRSSSAVLTINGDDWTHTVQVEPTGYAEAVRFAQAINLAARTNRAQPR
jgi:uncharacterized membrane protein